MNTKTKTIISISLITVLIVGLLLLGTFLDLEISKALAIPSDTYITDNAFTLMFEAVGESCLYILLGCAAIIVAFASKTLQNKKLSNLLQVLFIALGFVAWFVCLFRTLDYIGESLSLSTKEFALKPSVVLIQLFFSAVFNTLTYFAFRNCSEETILKLFKWALVVLIVAALSNLIVQGLKIFWGRFRFRAMATLEDFSSYTPWYHINGKQVVTAEQTALGIAGDAYKSFPSGHTCAATSLMLIGYLPSVLEKFNTKLGKIVCWTVPSIFVFLTGLSRILCGAHFFTDIFVSFLITFGIILIVKYLIIDNGYKKFKKNK